MPPNQQQRQKCWDSRDRFFACLEQNEENAAKCQSLRQEFEGCCSNTWVKYFLRKREYDKYKEKLETEGFKPYEAGKKT
ncbi:cytochrome c oxidase assembly factor 6 homolog [Branchiostoma lanceolatum]|uniref:COA6 protein n=1 Tax=Branchiostoma lanceolatum TaxID=7740 RepID=A0A8J9ZUQ5_BRALA|nr:COA6 [Branchiostoma lanceolatum]